MKKTLFFTCAFLLGLAASAQSYYFEDATPHNATAAGAPIDCSGCHDAPVWGSPQDSRNPYLLNKQDNCGYCHNNKTGKNFQSDQAPFVKTHAVLARFSGASYRAPASAHRRVSFRSASRAV